MFPRISSEILLSLASQYKVVGIIGPRQSGKTTLIKQVFNKKPYVNLENLDTRQFATEDTRGFLHQYKDGAIFDEAQRVPSLFSYLQQHVDEYDQPGHFVLSGSNNFLLQENISQSLAGRIGYLTLLPFSISEISFATREYDLEDFMFKGFYPPLYDKPFEIDTWFENYIRTYLERDIRQIKNITDLNLFSRFLKLCAGRSGQLLNLSNLATEVGVDSKTVNAWIGVLEASFIVYRLQPFHQNFNKRLVKMPKLYFFDTGLACSLLSIRSADQLMTHPLRGSIFENFCMNEIYKYYSHQGIRPQMYFWRNHTGNEVDLIVDQGNKQIPVEFKMGSTISEDYFRGLKYWLKLSKTTSGLVVHGGDQSQRRSDGLTAIGWKQISNSLSDLDM